MPQLTSPALHLESAFYPENKLKIVWPNEIQAQTTAVEPEISLSYLSPLSHDFMISHMSDANLRLSRNPQHPSNNFSQSVNLLQRNDTSVPRW
jgi:hypothetical protein